MKTIPLTQGKFAIVDDSDFDRFGHLKWYAAKAARGGFYAMRARIRTVVGKPACVVPLHREIMQAPDGSTVDHINGDTLDNRRANLRFVTQAQNCQNRAARKNGTSRFKGVCWNKDSKKWQAQIRVGCTLKYLGLFKDESDAAQAYDFAATNYFGEFARLNFPKQT